MEQMNISELNFWSKTALFCIIALVILLSTGLVSATIQDTLRDNTLFYFSADNATVHGSTIENLVNGSNHTFYNVSFTEAVAVYGGSVYNLTSSRAGWNTNQTYSNNNNFSMSVWIHPTLSFTGERAILGNDGGAFNAKTLLYNGSGHVRTKYCAPSTCGYITASNTLIADQWNHIVYSVENSTGTFYINGVSSGGGTDTRSSGLQYHVMSEPHITSPSTQGYVDEIAFFSKPLFEFLE